jgi:hypothetical protein
LINIGGSKLELLVGLGIIFIVIILINIDHNIVIGFNNIEKLIENKKHEI